MAITTNKSLLCHTISSKIIDKSDFFFESSKMFQWVMTLTMKTDDLNLTSAIHMVDGEN